MRLNLFVRHAVLFVNNVLQGDQNCMLNSESDSRDHHDITSCTYVPIVDAMLQPLIRYLRFKQFAD